VRKRLFVEKVLKFRYNRSIMSKGDDLVRIAVCDDEQACKERIVEFIQAYKSDDLNIDVFEFSGGEELVKAYEQGEKFDAAFLDVEMPGVSGVDVGHAIRKLGDNNIMFVFVTGHTKYVPEAFHLNAFQFLVKPLEQNIFNRKFDRIISTCRKKKVKYAIRIKEATIHLEIKDILFVETFGRQLKLTSTAKEYEYYGSIGKERKKLEAYNFICCHQGYLVNMQYIEQLQRTSFLLVNGTEIPISKHLKTAVSEKYNQFISGYSV